MNLLRQFILSLVCYILFPCAVAQGALAAELRVTDDASKAVKLAKPAQRIVSLSAHATELIFAAGAGAHLVGVDESSDYPPLVKTLPRVGRFGAYDIERILSLHPDLIIGWASGTPPALIDKLSTLKLPIFLSEPHELEDIAANLERLGILAGTKPDANASATDFRRRLAALAQRYSKGARVSVFYQIWSQPLMTVGGKQIISRSLPVCGGENVFAKLNELAPTVNREAVIAMDPEVLITGSKGGTSGDTSGDTSAPLAEWKAWPSMTAVKRGNMFVVNPDWLTRATPRMLDGLEQVCKDLEIARRRR